MHRIDTKTAQKDKFGAGKNGFTRGNPQTGTPATDLDDDYFDMLQEELCSVVEASGASLEKGRHDQLLTALRALLLSRKNPFGDIKSDGTVQTALENLGLGEAAKRDVGTGDNQIPDMGAFASGSGWFRLPGGYIVQFGTFRGNTDRVISGSFPIPFPNQPSVSVGFMSDSAQSTPSHPTKPVLSVNFEHVSNSEWRAGISDSSQQYRFSYISIGR
ncbi:TPA: hypothetical protein ACQJQZ_001151 [Escherichia coli]|nr:hypothetical protein [Escherichia coli]MCZ5296528.1 hypothetical protein [Escherichia coli]MCZ6039469.1 hypothetical protein [Escherichia coli]